MKKLFHITDIYSAYTGDTVCVMHLPEAPDHTTPACDRSDMAQGIKDLLDFVTSDSKEEMTSMHDQYKAAKKSLEQQFGFELMNEMRMPAFPSNMSHEQQLEKIEQWQKYVAKEYGEWHEVYSMNDPEGQPSIKGLMKEQAYTSTANGSVLRFTNPIQKLGIYKLGMN